jgi:hypothetical protein
MSLGAIIASRAGIVSVVLGADAVASGSETAGPGAWTGSPIAASANKDRCIARFPSVRCSWETEASAPSCPASAVSEVLERTDRLPGGCGVRARMVNLPSFSGGADRPPQG